MINKDFPFSEKSRYSLWLSNDNIKMTDKIYSLDNCKSRSEFVDRAIRFYCGYVETNIAQDYIADVFTQTVFPKLDNMKKVLNKSIYNMALQLSMLSHFEAALCDYELIILRSRQRLNTKLIFPSPITNGYRDPSSITRKLHRMQKRAGVPQIRFHDLRHSFATLSLEQGMDIKTISHMLGHTDAGFTMNTYMHVTDTMQQTVANAMGNLVAEKENEKRIKIIQYTA